MEFINTYIKNKSPTIDLKLHMMCSRAHLFKIQTDCVTVCILRCLGLLISVDADL